MLKSSRIIIGTLGRKRPRKAMSSRTAKLPALGTPRDEGCRWDLGAGCVDPTAMLCDADRLRSCRRWTWSATGVFLQQGHLPTGRAITIHVDLAFAASPHVVDDHGIPGEVGIGYRCLKPLMIARSSGRLNSRSRFRSIPPKSRNVVGKASGPSRTIRMKAIR